MPLDAEAATLDDESSEAGPLEGVIMIKITMSSPPRVFGFLLFIFPPGY